MNRESRDRARAKITKESQDIGSPLAIFIEEHVNGSIDRGADASAVESKELKSLINKIENKARETKKGNVGMVSDSDVIEMTNEFYGLKETGKKAGIVDVLDLL